MFFAAKNGHVEIVQNLLFHKAKTEILVGQHDCAQFIFTHDIV